MARVMQHEFDHLNGLLYVDRLDPKQRTRAQGDPDPGERLGQGAARWLPGVDRTRSATTTNRTSMRTASMPTGHDERLA